MRENIYLYIMDTTSFAFKQLVIVKKGANLMLINFLYIFLYINFFLDISC